MKKIEIEIPEGKEAKWMNGVLTLVDEKPKDITKRIKTFEDALKELGEDNQLVKEYRQICETPVKGETVIISQDLIAYLKLRIIVTVLNEGWEPKFEKGEYRYYPWFYLYTKEQYDKLDDEKKGRCVLHSSSNKYSTYSSVSCYAHHDAPVSYISYGSHLAFRNRETAEYAGKQFAEEWFAFVFNVFKTE